MKTKLVLAGILLFSISSSFAQNKIPKGSTLLGGDFYLNKFTDKDDFGTTSNSGFFIAPVFSKAVRDNFFIGATAGIGIYTNKSSGLDSSKTHAFNYGMLARKYQGIKNNFYIFLQGGIAGTSSNTKLENNDAGRNYYNKQFSLGAFLSPGIAYAINSKLQIETGLNNIINIAYTENKLNDNLTSMQHRKVSSFNVNTSLNNFASQLYFGFRLLLQKKDKLVASK